MTEHLSRAEFEKVVEEAVESLPEEFAQLLENVVIVVEEEPTEEDYAILDEEEAEYDDLDEELDEEDDDDEGEEGGEEYDDDESELLGIYRGAPRTVRTHDMLPMLPDQIAIFRGPILRIARNRRDAVREVRETVIHELGHYFGLDDEGMVF